MFVSNENTKYNCMTCGAELFLSSDRKSGTCPYCHNAYHFKEEKGPALVLALNNANGYLRRNDFDNAIVHYESILKEYPKDAEAAWGHTLSTYGIVYARDDRTQQMIPTCSRIIKESILQNKSYLLAIKECAEEQRPLYEKEAAKIDKIQRNIKRAMEDEEDFDVFISFKAKDENDIPTEDSVIARNIYDELEKREIKTFFSEVTLSDRIGENYEPIIYRALYSCKFFILVATREDYINAPWVKNEWTRFRDRVNDESLSGACTAVFKDVTPYNLPKIFQTQGIELAKHPFDYAQLITNNLSKKFGYDNELEEQKRKNAELEEKLKKLEEAQKNTNTAASGAIDKDTLASMMRQIEEDKNRVEKEAKRKAEEEKRRAEFDIENGRLKRYTGSSPNVVIPNSVTSIGDSAFYNCRSLESVTIPESVTNIGNYAFSGCSSLNSVTIPNSVTSIDSDAFYNCRSLESVTIPESVTNIGNYAFSSCSSLESITVSEGNPAYKSIDGNLYTKDGKTLVQYAIGKTDSSFMIPDSVTSIGYYALKSYNNLKIYVPNSENINMWNKDWNPDNRPVFDAKTGKQLKKNIFGKWK